MSVDTFIPPLTPSIGSSEKPELKILKADFGDGYTQATRNGMNSVRRVVTLKWEVLTVTQAAQIIAFVTTHGGTDPFFYRMPDDATPTLWTCEDFDEGYPFANYRSVNATFRQSFNLVS